VLISGERGKRTRGWGDAKDGGRRRFAAGEGKRDD